MAKAIRGVELDPYVINAQNEYLLKSNLYAYLRYPFPVLLCEKLVNISDPLNHQLTGLHAVTVTGFSLGLTAPIPFNNFSLRASRIDKIYAHDDQLGPFSRMVIDGVKVTVEGETENSLSTSWRPETGSTGAIRAVPLHLIVPLYHKIRIPFAVVEDAVIAFDGIIQPLKTKHAALIDSPLEWDIYLTSVNDVKKETFEGEASSAKAHRDLLLEELPRFIWKATLRNEARPILTLLFDATDVQQGRFFLRAVEYDESLALVLRAFSKSLASHLINVHPHLWRIVQWFADQC